MADNKASDLKQYENYREAKIKGLPRGAKKFQQLKYADTRAYSETKRAYAEYSAFANKITSPEEATRFIRQYANKQISWQKQNRHIVDSGSYVKGRSVLSADPIELVDKYAGTGVPRMSTTGVWTNVESISTDKIVGICLSHNADTIMTNYAKIHYSKTGVHLVPSLPKKTASKGGENE